MQEILNRILVQITILRRKLILSISADYLGIDFTPHDIVPDEFGCAEAVTTILKKTGTFHAIIPGTWTLYDALNRSRHWTPSQKPKPGDIIISPTGESRLGRKAPFVGHVGIVGKNGLIFSNDSYSGKWKAHYTIQSWKDRYQGEGGYPVLYYTYISVL